MKLKSSPSGAPSWRRRWPISDFAFGCMRKPARMPATLAGDSRKIRHGGEPDVDACSTETVVGFDEPQRQSSIFESVAHITEKPAHDQNGLVEFYKTGAVH